MNWADERPDAAATAPDWAMRVAEQIWDGDSEAQWQTPEDWIRNAAALIRQAGSRESTKLRADYDREHKWLNDAASEASSDLDSVASVIRKLREAGSERERELTQALQKYGRHAVGCKYNDQWAAVCDCGWPEASRLLGGESK